MARNSRASSPRASCSVGPAGVGRHAGEIGAGAERLVARAGEHDDAHVVVGLRDFEGVAQLGHHLPRQRVAAFGPVDRDRGDAVGHVVQHRFVGHPRERSARLLPSSRGPDVGGCRPRTRDRARPAGPSHPLRTSACAQVGPARQPASPVRSSRRGSTVTVAARADAALARAARVVRDRQPPSHRHGRRGHRPVRQHRPDRAEPGHAGARQGARRTPMSSSPASRARRRADRRTPPRTDRDDVLVVLGDIIPVPAVQQVRLVRRSHHLRGDRST